MYFVFSTQFSKALEQLIFLPPQLHISNISASILTCWCSSYYSEDSLLRVNIIWRYCSHGCFTSTLMCQHFHCVSWMYGKWRCWWLFLFSYVCGASLRGRFHITLPKSLNYLRTALNNLGFWVVGGWILSVQAGSSAWNSSLILQTKYSLTTQYSIKSSLCIFSIAICFLTSQLLATLKYTCL